jgi:Domain of Unknown Function with PDB structure (DUF3857)/Transglutaminase-like superfamily
MRNRWFWNRSGRLPAISPPVAALLLGIAIILLPGGAAFAGSDAPPWMHAAANAPLPAYDDRTDAVLLYAETNVTVVSSDKVKTVVREAYKILKPTGREHGTVFAHLNANRKINNLHGWCIPAHGKDYEVKDKDSIEASPPNIPGADLISDVKFKLLHIPAADPGNVVGFEYEVEEHPLVLQDNWDFQGTDPVRESHYSLQLPGGWECKTAWLNYHESQPTQPGPGRWAWAVSDIPGIHKEDDMPPLRGLLGQMIVYYFPPGGSSLNGFTNWQQMGNWYRNLTTDRLAASPEIKQQVAALIASKSSQLGRMQAIAAFVQQDIRYVAIELGIGGWQPHPAADIYAHRYGDCKDKATLTSAMLREIGIDSYYVAINTARGSVTAETPAYPGGFNHVIVAIKLPTGLSDASLGATLDHPRLGKLLFFDPTNELIPFGQIGGYLQANYGLLVTPEGGELIELPTQPALTNSIRRVAHLTLDPEGNLQGAVEEVRLGDRAWAERSRVLKAPKDSDRIKPLESLLSDSLSNFHLTRASLVNLHQTDQPFGFNYSFEASNYAKHAGDLLLVRLRVLGVKTRAILETKEPRVFPIEFDGPARDMDEFDITLPPGYVVDELPPPVDVDFEFASYHSRTVVNGNVIGYNRTFEVKQLSVPVSKAEELRKFYRIIASDERNTAVLKRVQ